MSAIKSTELSSGELKRYARHLILPEVGVEGQKKLKAASVLIVGVGGLGSPLALYLAAAGVGRIGLVDFDVVDESNLQRQILHSSHDIGRSKLASAQDRILAANPNVRVDAHNERLTSANALDIIEDYDVVVDGTDNFPTRYLINDACVLLKKPNVYGSVFRFEGQASVFDATRGPCYRCVYPAPPPAELVQNCADAGVIGVLPGIIGTLQASETIKLILGIGNALIGRVLMFDALSARFRETIVKRDPDCPVCGTHPTITSLIDYEKFCGNTKSSSSNNNPKEEMTVQELKARLDKGDDIVLLDVRQPDENAFVNIGGVLIPLGELQRRFKELDPSKEIVAYCHHGIRSMQAVHVLRQAGFMKVESLSGGIAEWARVIDPTLPQY
jgi:sulfur-carrier protein adenylyltransferase/sulfurtransferase